MPGVSCANLVPERSDPRGRIGRAGLALGGPGARPGTGRSSRGGDRMAARARSPISAAVGRPVRSRLRRDYRRSAPPGTRPRDAGVGAPTVCYEPLGRPSSNAVSSRHPVGVGW